MSSFTASDLEGQIRGYMDACTSGDADRIEKYLAEDAFHYFPPDMYEGPGYYASPQDDSLQRLELGGFDYTGRGYPQTR